MRLCSAITRSRQQCKGASNDRSCCRQYEVTLVCACHFNQIKGSQMTTSAIDGGSGACEYERIVQWWKAGGGRRSDVRHDRMRRTRCTSTRIAFSRLSNLAISTLSCCAGMRDLHMLGLDLVASASSTRLPAARQPHSSQPLNRAALPLCHHSAFHVVGHHSYHSPRVISISPPNKSLRLVLVQCIIHTAISVHSHRGCAR